MSNRDVMDIDNNLFFLSHGFSQRARDDGRVKGEFTFSF